MHNTNFRAVSSVYGRIDHILIVHIINNDTAANPEVILNLYNNIPNHVKFFVYIVDQRRGDGPLPTEMSRTVTDFFSSVQSNGEPDTRRLTLIFNNAAPLTGTWIQDYFFVLESQADIPAFLEQIQSRHIKNYGGDKVIADTLASETDFTLKPFPYAFRGGNILVGDDYMLIAESILRTNADTYDKSETAVTEAFRCGFGIRHLVRLDYAQNGTELGDLDMFITLGGKTMHEGIEKELVFVGHVDPADVLGFSPDEVEGIAQNYNILLDDIAGKLKRWNKNNVRFRVERTPLVVDRQGREETRLRSYNNCLVEIYGRVKNIYIPSYTSGGTTANGTDHYSTVEARAREIFESYGFTVVSIQGDFVATSDRRGALHCVTNVLKRSESGRSWDVPFSHRTPGYNGSTDGVSTTYLADRRALVTTAI